MGDSIRSGATSSKPKEAPKAQKLMGDAIRSGAASSKPKEASKPAAPKPKTAPKRSTRNIPVAEKNKAPMPEAAMEEEDDSVVLRKLKPKIQITMMLIQLQRT